MSTGRVHPFPVAVVTAAILVSSAARPWAQATPRQQQPPGTRAPSVPVAMVISQPFERTVVLPADLVAFQDVAIHARVEGFVERIDVDRGSVVRRGTLLARVEAPELKARIDEAEARVQNADAQRLEAEALLAAERSTFDRLKSASATPGVVAGNDLEIASQKAEASRARVLGAERNVDAARQAVRSLRDMDAYLDVKAPFDGVVTERTAHVGSLVGPGSGPLARMQQISRLRLVAPVPEAYVSSVKVGQTIQFTVAAFPGETFSGNLARSARVLEVKTRSMAVELDVANAAGRLAPGMFAEVQWPARRGAPSLFVPRTAVAVTTERSFVVRVRNGLAEWVDVRRGATMEGLIEVFGDLKAGDQVAVRATDELRSGTRVTPVQQAGR